MFDLALKCHMVQSQLLRLSKFEIINLKCCLGSVSHAQQFLVIQTGPYSNFFVRPNVVSSHHPCHRVNSLCIYF